MPRSISASSIWATAGSPAASTTSPAPSPIDDAKPEASKVKVEINTDSINSNHAERDKHLRSEDFLDTAKYPKAVFESTAVKMNGDKATIVGNLTLHGVTKQIEIAAEPVGGGDDPWGGYRQGFIGTTKLPLKDFGIDFDLGPASKRSS